MWDGREVKEGGKKVRKGTRFEMREHVANNSVSGNKTDCHYLSGRMSITIERIHASRQQTKNMSRDQLRLAALLPKEMLLCVYLTPSLSPMLVKSKMEWLSFYGAALT